MERQAEGLVCRTFLVLLLGFLIGWKEGTVSAEMASEAPLEVFPYRLSADSAFGRILDTALTGSRVPMDTSLPSFQTSGGSKVFLQLFLNPSGGSPIKHTDSNTNSSSRAPTGLTALPAGLKVKVSGEQSDLGQVDSDFAFAVDDRLFVVVDNSHTFSHVKEIEFWVVTVRQASGQNTSEAVVSNPLSFVVRVDHAPLLSAGRKSKALYVGVVVLVVCLIVCLIPITIRTKRRRRQGKPLFACGSSSDKLEKKRMREQTGNGIETGSDVAGQLPMGNRSASVPVLASGGSWAGGGQAGGMTCCPGGGVAAGHSHSHVSFDRYMPRSMSRTSLQPLWLDTHYKQRGCSLCAALATPVLGRRGFKPRGFPSVPGQPRPTPPPSTSKTKAGLPPVPDESPTPSPSPSEAKGLFSVPDQSPTPAPTPSTSKIGGASASEQTAVAVHM